MSLDRDIFTVSRLNSEVRMTIERSFPLIWVQGEISNFMRPRSGHFYFSLKDEYSQARCAMFRGKQRLLRFTPKDGDQVIARVRLSIYEPRGDFQLLVEQLEPAGEGALSLAFEALKKKLAAENLFDTDRKKPIPTMPRRIGIVTSPSGAAVRDVLHVLKRRYARLPVVIYPVPVQGDNAAQEIRQMLLLAEQRNECDLLILTRGGGSLEDLNAFNDEQLARTIAACKIPIISAVGHETDFTIADFVADQRAPTPSAAAEISTPDGQAIGQKFTETLNRLQFLQQQQNKQAGKKLQHLSHRLQLQHPSRALQQQQQRLDQLNLALESSMSKRLKELRLRQQFLQTRLRTMSPEHQLEQVQKNLDTQQKRLFRVNQQLLQNRQNKHQTLAHRLHTASPLATMSRGYSISRQQTDQQILRSVEDVDENTVIETMLSDGSIFSTVTDISKK